MERIEASWTGVDLHHNKGPKDWGAWGDDFGVGTSNEKLGPFGVAVEYSY